MCSSDLDFIQYRKSNGFPEIPVSAVPLACSPVDRGFQDGLVSKDVRQVSSTRFVLCVCTIEIRKNHILAFNIWREWMRVASEEAPTLVLVGRRGWRVQDLFDQLESTAWLNGKIVHFEGISDRELALLYQNCLFSIFQIGRAHV